MNGSEGGDRQFQNQRLKGKENALYPKPKDLGFAASDCKALDQVLPYLVSRAHICITDCTMGKMLLVGAKAAFSPARVVENKASNETSSRRGEKNALIIATRGDGRCPSTSQRYYFFNARII